MWEGPPRRVVKGIAAAEWLREASRGLDPGDGVAVVYHPLDYGWEAHRAYLERYGNNQKKALLVGMNPGPWGMGQTGVPFGDVELVGDWLGLRGIPVARPLGEHPKRPVLGWACTRREASGQRLWGHLKERFGTPQNALRDLLIVNHCPLLMFTETGGNVTPDKLPRARRDEIYAVCDEGLKRAARAYGPDTLIAIGRYAEERCRAVAATLPSKPGVLTIPHPSPASPLANKDGGKHWRDAVDRALATAGLAMVPT
jgi:single-strand selective monofunctional uracil DNA glycosylase